MLQKFILNNMAKELTKHERDTLNNIINTMVGNPRMLLGADEYGEYCFWQKYCTDVDPLSPLTVRVFYWIADQLGGNTLQIFQLWKPELIFLTIQATDKYPFNIFIDDDLGKRYLEKAMAVVSLHYEDWEV